MFRMLNRRDCPLDRSLVSHEKAADEISAPEPMFRSLNGRTESLERTLCSLSR